MADPRQAKLMPLRAYAVFKEQVTAIHPYLDAEAEERDDSVSRRR
jgi:hypothetical protein